MEDSEKRLKTGLGCAIILLALPSMFLYAWAISIMWGWFVTPTYGLPSPALKTIVGVDFMISLVIAQYTGPNETVQQIYTKIGRMVLYPPVILGFGWIVKWFL